MSHFNFVIPLHKDDLWAALNEYPEARKLLLDIGREILAKDDMIDQEKAKREEAAKLNLDEKIVVLKEHVRGLKTRFDRLSQDYSSFSSVCDQKVNSICSKSQ